MIEDTSTIAALSPEKKTSKPKAKAKTSTEETPAKKAPVRKKAGPKVEAVKAEVVAAPAPKAAEKKAPVARSRTKSKETKSSESPKAVQEEFHLPTPAPARESAPAPVAPRAPEQSPASEGPPPQASANVARDPQDRTNETDRRPQQQQGQNPQRPNNGGQQGDGGNRWGGRDRRRDHRHGRNRNRDRDRHSNRDQNNGGQQSGDPQNRDNNTRGDQRPDSRADQQQRGDQGDRQPLPERPLGPPEPAEGILELSPKGYGFLRQRDRGFAQTPNDAFVSPEQIRKYGLREGMMIKGVAQRGHRGPQMTEIAEVNARPPEEMRDLPLFEELKAVNPNKRILFETVPSRLTTRVIDLVTPVGRGQRGLIVAPPRAGKTTLLQHVAEAVTQLHPQMHLMILLIDERPEEVTEFKRLLPKAEIFASSNDMDLKSHTRIAAFAIERAKRLVECGQHVFILMDSITRMARAYNNASKGGATMSGGVGVGALEIPRRLFAAARNTRTAGSITILATALIETGSRMDDLIFQEFKGTGNMELVLDRRIAEQYVFPAVNVLKSGTRREELLTPAFQLEKIHMLRRGLAGHKPIEAMQRVVSLLERFPSNSQMLVDLPSK